MSIQKKLFQLADQQNSPSVTLSFNTHRTAPDNQQDSIKLKNYIKEAEDRLLHEFEKREIQEILDKLEELQQTFEVSKNLESVHIFISADTFETIRSTWHAHHEGVWIDDKFSIRNLIKAANRTEEYYLLYLTQKGVHFIEVENDQIIGEIENEDFPFTENRYNLTHLIPNDDVSQSNKVKEFYNMVDKAVLKVLPDHDKSILVISTDDNFNILKSVADYPEMYKTNLSTNFNSPTQAHEFVKDAWETVKNLQSQDRTHAIEEMQEAVGRNQVVTDLQEIYQAAIDGRGDLLIVHQDYQQAVQFIDERTFKLEDDATAEGVVDDITSLIAWEVISKKGRAIFTNQEEIKDLGNIVLKVRY